MPTPTEWLAPTEFDPTDPVGVLGRDYHIIGLSNGNFLVAFDSDDNTFGPSTGRDIIGRIYDAEGNVVRDWFQINVARTSDNEEDFSIAATNDGGFVIAYIDNDISNPNESALIWQRHVSNGVMTASAVIDAESTADGQFLSPSVAVNQLTNETVITFQETVPAMFPLPAHQNIYSVTVSSNGTVSAQFNAADNSAGDESAPNVAILTNGNIVTAYLEDSSGVARTEFRVMTPGGSVIRTRTVDSGLHETPNVTALANGNFVISWDEKNPDFGDDRIGYQVFFSNGISATVAQFLDQAYGIDEARYLDAVALPDGGFVLGWSNSANGNFILQRFNANGTIDGSKISLFIAPLEVSLDLTSDGRILIAWAGGLGIDPGLAIYDPRDAVIDASDFELGLPNFTETDVITALLTDTTINGDDDDNTLLGQAGDDTLNGALGNDTLDGGAGDDDMVGGIGDDTYYIDSLNDTATELAGEGTDRLNTSINLNPFGSRYENIEVFALIGSATAIHTTNDGETLFANTDLTSKLFAYGGDDTLIGGAGNDKLYGGAGNDTINGGVGKDRIDGGTGADAMAGGIGDDRYFVDDLGDTVTELAAEGTDIVKSTVDWTLGDHLENLRLGPTAAEGIGNDLDNTIFATSASELRGNGGHDNLRGSNGSDTVFGDGGNDTINGRSGADVIHGGSGNDFIKGRAGEDTIFGDSGDDLIIGGADNDMISGGADQDELKGEGGADTFLFADGDFAGLTDETADRITDFSQSDGDLIDLSAVDAILGNTGDDTFTFIADAAFSGTAGELRFEQADGNTMVFMDVDGDGAADYAIRLDGTINLAEANFIL